MSDYDWTKWSEWRDLRILDVSSVPDGAGAYVIAFDGPISRAIDTDPHGFLDVGESGSLRQRLRAFIRCATDRGQEGHMAGWRYARFCFKDHFPFVRLRVRWLETQSKSDAYKAESNLLHEYLKRHCELPPLNYKFNWKSLDVVVAQRTFDRAVT